MVIQLLSCAIKIGSSARISRWPGQ